MSSLTASLFFLRQCLSLHPELTVLGRLAGQQGPTMNLFLISWCLGCSCINILSMWVLIWGHFAYKTKPFTMESSLSETVSMMLWFYFLHNNKLMTYPGHCVTILISAEILERYLKSTGRKMYTLDSVCAGFCGMLLTVWGFNLHEVTLENAAGFWRLNLQPFDISLIIHY